MSHASMGCKTGKITEITDFGIFHSGSDKEANGTCFYDPLDTEDAGCVALS
jgi:hypothetical protein